MKNKIIISIIAALFVCTAATACTKAPTAPERTGKTESEIPSQPDIAHYHFVEREDKTPYVVKKEATDGEIFEFIKNSCEKVSFVAHDRVDSTAASKMNSVFDAAYSYHESATTAMIKDLEDYLLSESVDMSVFPWETKIDYTCVRNDGKAISVVENIDYRGGISVYAYNFDPLTGDHVTNIFYTTGDKESLDAMDNLVYNKLIEKYGEDSGITYSMPNLVSMIDCAMGSWYFTETGAKLIFNPGSIAPIENGSFELDLSKEELPETSLKYFN